MSDRTVKQVLLLIGLCIITVLCGVLLKGYFDNPPTPTPTSTPILPTKTVETHVPTKVIPTKTPTKVVTVEPTVPTDEPTEQPTDTPVPPPPPTIEIKPTETPCPWCYPYPYDKCLCHQDAICKCSEGDGEYIFYERGDGRQIKVELPEPGKWGKREYCGKKKIKKGVICIDHYPIEERGDIVLPAYPPPPDPPDPCAYPGPGSGCGESWLAFVEWVKGILE